MNHIMVDLETLSTATNAHILEIGAVGFKLPRGALEASEWSEFSVSVSHASGARRDINLDTVMWWLGQSQEARDHAVQGCRQGLPLEEALVRLSEWVLNFHRGRPQANLCVWGNGATFDNVILDSAFQATGVKKPWSYRADRCYRTLTDIFSDVEKPKPVAGTVFHTALGDARHQAQHLALILQHIQQKE